MTDALQPMTREECEAWIFGIWGIPIAPPIPSEADDDALYGKAKRNDKGEPVKAPAEAHKPHTPGGKVADDAEYIRARMRELGLDT